MVSPYISKLMAYFLNIDRMIGSDFNKGLSNLTFIAEAKKDLRIDRFESLFQNS